MIHQPLGGAQGQAADVRIQAEPGSGDGTGRVYFFPGMQAREILHMRATLSVAAVAWSLVGWSGE